MMDNNKPEFLEIDIDRYRLDRYRIHVTINTFWITLGIWIYHRWLWEIEYKRVCWMFYEKIRLVVAFFSIEYINIKKSYNKKDVRSTGFIRDMRFWK